jgi:hypothetical protein
MSNDADTPTTSPQPARRHRKRLPKSLIRLINSTTITIGALYAATHSIAVSGIGAVVAITLVMLYLRAGD